MLSDARSLLNDFRIREGICLPLADVVVVMSASNPLQLSLRVYIRLGSGPVSPCRFDVDLAQIGGPPDRLHLRFEYLERGCDGLAAVTLETALAELADPDVAGRVRAVDKS